VIQQNFDLGFPIAVVAAFLFVFIILIVLIKRYKRCPSDRILVVYGRWRTICQMFMVVQPYCSCISDYEFLDLTPPQLRLTCKMHCLSKTFQCKCTF
jgi:flotillin